MRSSTATRGWQTGPAALLALALTACGTGGSKLGWVWSLGGSLLVGSLKWTVLLGGLGLVAAPPFYWVLRRSGALDADWRLAPYFRFLTLLALLLVFPLTFAYAGFYEGVLRAARYQLSEGSVAQDVYPAIGGAGANYVGAVFLVYEQEVFDIAEPLDSAVLLAAFRSGEKEIDSERIPEVLAHVESEVLQGLAQEAKKEAQERLPILKEGIGQQILDWFVTHCSEALVGATPEEDAESDRLGPVAKLFRNFVVNLPAAGERQGDPGLLSYEELSRYVVEATLAKGILKLVVVPFCRGQQIGGLVILFLTVLIPISVLRGPALCARWWNRRRREPTPR